MILFKERSSSYARTPVFNWTQYSFTSMCKGVDSENYTLNVDDKTKHNNNNDLIVELIGLS